LVALARILPTLEPAAQLTLGWTHPISSSFAFSLLGGPRLSSTSRVSDDQGNVDLAFYGATVAACASAWLQLDGWLASGCVALEPGVLAAHGRDTRNPHEKNRGWFALGPGVGVAWAAASPLVLEAALELQMPLVRDRFVLGGETVFRPPSAGLRAGLGVGVRLW
jgi:hypothetical protein